MILFLESRMDWIKKYEAILFDLDNTIYPEKEYLERAYKNIARNVSIVESNLLVTESEISNFLLKTFESEGRDKIFQKMKTQFQINSFTLENFLECMHNTPLEKNELKVYPYIYDLLVYLKRYNLLLFVVTNGNVNQQQNKINALNLDTTIFNEIIYTSSMGKYYEKPSSFFIEKIKLDYSLNGNKMLLFGDSPIDKATALNAGIDFINVQTFNTNSKNFILN